ncbi:uncharacterized protein NPIL_86321, partial [Nephila pilipes]
MYLDDILTGYSNLKELELLKSELVQLFESAGMSLHKWNFSHSNSDLPDLQFDQLSEEDTMKTLEPVISEAKFFMQSLWLLKIDWHEKLPAAVAKEWFCKNARLSCGERVIGPLSLKELEKADFWLLQFVQKVKFFEDIKTLKNGEPVPRNN